MLLRVLALLAAWLFILVPARAQNTEPEIEGSTAPGSHSGEAGSGYFSTHFGFYDKDDSGAGNPFLDEDLTVLEAILIYDYDVSDRFGYNIKLSYDNVSSASIDRLSNFPEQSGASGDYYAGLDFAARWHTTDLKTWGAHVGTSVEYDYMSVGLGGSLSVDSDDRNRTLTYSLDAYLDQVDVIRFNGVEEGDDDRTSLAGTVAWYQVMGPRTHGDFGLTISKQSGFLETAFNSIVVEDGMTVPPFPFENGALGFEVAEELPDDRLRTALYGKVRHLSTPISAWELGGRLYSDDWGITGISIEPRYYRDLAADRLRMRLRYRYYTQSEADAYQENFFPGDEGGEVTQDSDLADFDSHTMGVKFSWLDKGKPTFDVSLDYVTRSDDLDHILALFGWTWRF